MQLGKYDQQLLRVLLQTGASSGCLLLLGGPAGPGASFKVNVPRGVPKALALGLGLRAIVKMLRDLADTIEAAIPQKVDTEVN